MAAAGTPTRWIAAWRLGAAARRRAALTPTSAFAFPGRFFNFCFFPKRAKRWERLGTPDFMGYRGVSGFYDPAILTFPFLRSPRRALGTPDFSTAYLFFSPESPALCQFFLCVLCALCANPVFDLWNERKPGYRAVAKRKSA